MSSVFRLYFDTKDNCKITECCDYYYDTTLSVEDLKQLSAYFLDIARFIENTNKN